MLGLSLCEVCKGLIITLSDIPQTNTNKINNLKDSQPFSPHHCARGLPSPWNRVGVCHGDSGSSGLPTLTCRVTKGE